MDDRTKATALEVAERQLKRLGHRHSAKDVGKTAAVIINALEAGLNPQDDK